ncbi:MAG: nodulation protein NfeD [Thermoplasmata archaeon]|nr:MAG: nodulation protein NfeD [Thermoplasmata archaeon]
MKLKNHLFLSFLILIFIFLSLYGIGSSSSSNVLIVDITGTIDQSTVETLKESLNQAEIENSEAVILLIDTPGGGLQETFEIARLINKSSIPVVGFVYPSGSTAWSAGTFILMSTHIAAMCTHTIIGSCQPVEIGISGTRLINDSKTINALTKWIEERADMFNRNKSIVKRFITENLDLNETLSLKYGVIEYTASSVEQLIQNINGTSVKTSKGIVVLDTRYAKTIHYSPSIAVVFMKFFSNPVLTSILFILGVFALLVGISSPGFGAEVFGVIAILLSLIGSGFSISTLSIIFIAIGVLLLVIEIFVTPGFGVIGIGGIISFIVGGIFLLPSYTNKKWLISMSWYPDAIIIILTVAVLLAIFFIFLLYKILQVRKKKAAIGVFIGETAKTVDKITPDKSGYVRFRGELWRATSDTEIAPNTKVEIIAKDETTLKVKPKNS